MKSILVVIVIAVLAYLAVKTLTSSDFSGTTIHLAGDSTLSEQLDSERPLTGWGESLPSFLCDGVRVLNHAKNGRSTRSFLSEGLWSNLLAQLRDGDIVKIQFGHNDQKKSNPTLYSDAWQGYQDHLTRFVADVRALGATPVLLTPIVRRDFDLQGELQNTLGDYPSVTRHVANEQKVELIDLNALTSELIQNMGPTESKSIYLHLSPNTHGNYPEGEQDNTHLNAKGAFKVAELSAIELQRIRPDLVCL